MAAAAEDLLFCLTAVYSHPRFFNLLYPPLLQQLLATQSADRLHPLSINRKKERGIWSKLCLFIPGAIAFGLGRSFAGKIRRVVCKGVFDEKRSIFVGPRSRSISGVTENGYYVITPLMHVPGDPESVQLPVLVNRGWVPRSWRDKFFEGIKDAMQYTEPPPSTLQAERNPWWKIWSKISERNEEEAPVATNLKEVVGVIRGSEKPSIFVPANDPRSGQWFYVDVPAIDDASGLPHEIIYIEDIDSNVNPSNPYPIPKDVNTLIRTSVLPHDHLNYIITWYSLSTAVTVMAYKRQKTTKRRF